MLISGRYNSAAQPAGFIHVRIALLWPLILIAVRVWVLLHNFALAEPARLVRGFTAGITGIAAPGALADPLARRRRGRDGHLLLRRAHLLLVHRACLATPAGTPPPGSYGFQGGAMPENPREWLRWHKWEARRQRRAWRHGWRGQAYAQPGTRQVDSIPQRPSSNIPRSAAMWRETSRQKILRAEACPQFSAVLE